MDFLKLLAATWQFLPDGRHVIFGSGLSCLSAKARRVDPIVKRESDKQMLLDKLDPNCCYL